MKSTHQMTPSFEEYCKEIESLWDNRNEQRTKYIKFQKSLEEYFNANHVVIYANAKIAVEFLLSAMHFPKGSRVITTSSTPTYMVHAINDNGLITATFDFSQLKTSDESPQNSILFPQNAIAIATSLPPICKREFHAVVSLAQSHNLKIILDGTSCNTEDDSYVSLADNQTVNALVYRFGAGTPFSALEGAAICVNDEELYTALIGVNSSGIPGMTELEVDNDTMLLDEFSSAMGICILSHLK